MLRARGVGEKSVPVKLSLVLLVDDQSEDVRCFTDCLRLTKCMQKTAETLQGVADLYENHVSQRLCPGTNGRLPLVLTYSLPS